MDSRLETYSSADVFIWTSSRQYMRQPYMTREQILDNFCNINHKADFVETLFCLGNSYIRVMPTEGNADAKGITGFVTKVMIHEMAPEDYMGGLVHRADSLLFELTTDYDGVPDEHGILFIEDVTSKLTILERAKKDPSFKSELDRVAPEGSGLLIRATEYGLIPQGTKMYIREVPPASTECKYFCITM